MNVPVFDLHCDTALELLGKHLGMWTDKVEVTEKAKNPFEELTTEELRQLMDDD